MVTNTSAKLIRSLVITGFLTLSGLSMIGCSTTGTYQQTATSKAYLEEVKTYPTTFYLPQEDAPAAWERAKQWVRDNAASEIDLLSENKLRTYMPVDTLTHYGYNVEKIDRGDKVQFNVNSYAGHWLKKHEANLNAKLLAHYIATGEYDEPAQRLKSGY